MTGDSEATNDLAAACDAYEAALMNNDLDAMDALFLDSPLTLRYGVGENLYGIEAIREFRQSRTGGSPRREVLRREISLIGREAGISHLEFRRVGSSTTGRQSQVWILTADGWRVAAAHVSLLQATS